LGLLCVLRVEFFNTEDAKNAQRNTKIL
jgi:hypothetical protein